jgi:hypothetical protein
MARRRIQFGKIFVLAVIFLLLCGIVAGEFPELLSLTDNATNDFTVLRTKPVALTSLSHAGRNLSEANIFCSPLEPNFYYSRLNSFDAVASVPSERFILHSILRT